MSLFRKPDTVDPDEIEALAGLQPLFDPVFQHLLQNAIDGRIDVYFAAVPRESIRPFDTDYQPRKHPVGEAAVNATMDEWRQGKYPVVWVYQSKEAFVLSDDYIPWEAAKEGKPDYLPCYVLGKPDHPDVRDVQGPIAHSSIRRLLAIAQ